MAVALNSHVSGGFLEFQGPNLGFRIFGSGILGDSRILGFRISKA